VFTAIVTFKFLFCFFSSFNYLALYFGAYEGLKQYFTVNNNLSSFGQIMSGGLAGAIAWGILIVTNDCKYK
jgi:hypothetical protein